MKINAHCGECFYIQLFILNIYIFIYIILFFNIRDLRFAMHVFRADHLVLYNNRNALGKTASTTLSFPRLPLVLGVELRSHGGHPAVLHNGCSLVSFCLSSHMDG